MSFTTKETTIRPYLDLSDFDPTTREWSQNAVPAPGEVHWTKPYIDEATEEPVISASKAVRNNGKVIGVAGLDIQLATMSAEISASEIPYNGHAFLLDTEGTVIAHLTSVGENLMDQSYVAKMYKDERGHFNFKNDGSEKVDMYTTIPELGWKLGVVYEVSEMNALAAGLRNIMIIAAFISASNW